MKKRLETALSSDVSTQPSARLLFLKPITIRTVFNKFCTRINWRGLQTSTGRNGI